MTTETNEDIEIDIDTSLDAGKAVEIDLETGKEADPVVKAADPVVEDEGIKSLKDQMAAFKASAAERERTLQQEKDAALKEAATAKTQVVDSNYQVVISALEVAKREGDQAEADYAKAMDEGRHADAAKAQRIMARVEGRLDQLEGARQNFETERKAPKVEGAVRSEPQRPSDPVEALAGQLSAKSAAWVRQHPECATDQVLFQEMVAADARAQRLGHAPDSPEYFNFIEQRLGFAEPVVAERVEPAPQRRAVPSAPVSREAPGLSRDGKRYKLTPEEAEQAAIEGMSATEYAKHKVQYLAEQGRA